MTKAEALDLARRDYAAVRGTVIAVRTVECYIDETSVTIQFAEPKLFIVDGDVIHDTDIDRVVDCFLDPVYSVTPVNRRDPALENYTSFWVYGPSYYLKTGEKQPASGDWEPTGERPRAPVFVDFTEV